MINFFTFIDTFNVSQPDPITTNNIINNVINKVKSISNINSKEIIYE